MRLLPILLLAGLAALPLRADDARPPSLSPTASPASELFALDHLHAWCVVPFDAKKRGPEERAAMLQKLGFKHFVYDWRANDIPTFDAEIEALQRHGIELTGWWSPTDPHDPVLKTTLEVFRRHHVHPQLWVTGGGPPTKTPEEQTARVEAEANRIRGIVEAAKPDGCPVHLYTHDNWFGQTDNEIAIIERLKQMGVEGVGIVYNFSHGHNDLADFPALWQRMKPYVVAVNVTGMVQGGASHVIPPSQGDRELGMLKIILESGWRGPVGLIAEQGGDAEVTLGNNLRGLAWLTKELTQPGSGGERPSFATPGVTAATGASVVPGRFGQALDASNGGLLLPGKADWRTAPITVEAWVKLRRSTGFNIIVASDTKASGAHWEVYTLTGSGQLSVYLPGQGGEVHAETKICDNAWHYVAMVLEARRVRLFADGHMVQDKALPAASRPAVPGELGLGRTVEDGLGCDGLIDDVRISRGAREITAVPEAALRQDDSTLGLWSLDQLPKTVASAAAAISRPPLDPSAHPLAGLPINRERIYDFYAKEAIAYAKETDPPAFLPAFPGLDGGRSGHWGNQTEASWNNNRWNQMDIGPVQAGVFHSGNLHLPRAVCVRAGEVAACFDPDTLTWPAAWKGGVVRFGTARFGFLSGVAPAGPAIPVAAAPPAAAPGGFTYHGYYRNGARTVFSYQRDGREWLEEAAGGDGRVSIVREQAGAGPLSALTKGGPAQWPQRFETKGLLGHGQPYAIDTLTLPAQTPWHSLFHFGGFDFLPNGDAALCTMEGEVWIVSGIDDGLDHLTWRRFATGLHEALGLCVVDGKVCVLGRDQITRLHDLNGDGEADFYECFVRGYESPIGGHDFVTGMQRDSQGRFYLASGKQGVVRTSSDGQTMEVLATGLRNPDGVGLSPTGEVAVAVQEGDWTPASMVYQFRPQPGLPLHFGYGGPKPGPQGHVPPLAYLPRAEDNSCGGPCYVLGDRWGAPAGTLVHFSWGFGTAFLVLCEHASGHGAALDQGCVVPLPGDFRAGVHRGAFSPRDGQLYAAGMTGWITYAPEDGCFQRMRATGGAAQAPLATEAHANGVLLRFARPLEPGAAEASHFLAQEWSYRYSAAYGSEEYSVREPSQRGHDPLAVTSSHLLEGGRVLFLEIPQLQPANVLHLHADLPNLVSRDLYLTLHQLGASFTDYPGYQVIAKTPLEPPSGHRMEAMPSGTTAMPVPWERGTPGRPLFLETASGLQYAQKTLRAKAGERLSLTFHNPDAMPHNWVLVKVGSAERVGDLANKLISDPDALARNYVPTTPDVLCHTRVLDPAKSTTIHFNAPTVPGRYPYMCTFPGHWVLMRGELVVE